jgi:hypothetical protein
VEERLFWWPVDVSMAIHIYLHKGVHIVVGISRSDSWVPEIKVRWWVRSCMIFDGNGRHHQQPIIYCTLSKWKRKLVSFGLADQEIWAFSCMLFGVIPTSILFRYSVRVLDKNIIYIWLLRGGHFRG